MTTVRISRNQIIKAIKKEPLKTLRPGNFVLLHGRNEKVKNKTCSVCAVGAVMRNALLAPTQSAKFIERAADSNNGAICGDPQSELYDENYMAALSSFFELHADNIRRAREDERIDHELTLKETKQLRAETLRFVKDCFPKHVDVDIDGAKPAKDAKVVS